jgi:hypothetical protein
MQAKEKTLLMSERPEQQIVLDQAKTSLREVVDSPHVEPADGFHLLGPLEGLGVVDDEVDRFALPVEAAELLQGHGPQGLRFLPGASPGNTAFLLRYPRS